MSTWQEFMQRDAPTPEWPYPIRYGKENEITADVLILGGGIAGCHGAISAAKKGVKVVVVEKQATKRSGAGGAGVDHWQAACTNPCCKVSPEEFTKAAIDNFGGYDCGSLRYIHCKESWDALLDCERIGAQIRDVNDELKGADFRDEETKLMFAYDYENRHTLRVYGHSFKPYLYEEMKRSGVEIYDRVTATSLLTEGGRQGARVVGATGVNVRTGEFYVFKAKATVLATARPGRLWTGLVAHVTRWDGEGFSMVWNAGGEFAMLVHSGGTNAGFGHTAMGHPDNTWHGCTIVDAKGKEVPWVDRDDREIKTVAQRFRPAPGQKFMLMSGLVSSAHRGPSFPHAYENEWNRVVRDLPERIRKGEFTLPFYADLPSLPERERRAIFGLMVGQEGKTRIAIYYTLTEAGFDPDKDMLQSRVHPLEGYRGNFWPGVAVPLLRNFGYGGLVVDWDLRSNLEGLYAAGGCISGGGAHSSAAVGGRYAARKAAAYALTAPELVVDRKQVDNEKTRVYAPLKRSKSSIGWKELNEGICRIMQDYCGQYRSEETLKVGLRLLKELRESEATMAYAANPHELERILECYGLITVGEMVMHASLARKASSVSLNFVRLDYPEVDPPEWNKFLPMKLEDGKVKVRELPLDYHLRPPYAPTYEENYKLHCGL